MTLDVLEKLDPTPSGANIRLTWGKGKFQDEVKGRKIPMKAASYAAIRNHVHGFSCNTLGGLTSFGFVKFNLKNRQATEDANDMAQTFLTSYQFISLPMPNRD